MQATEIKRLDDKSAEIRRLVIEEIGRLGVGHIGGCLSIVEALVVLYYKQMHIQRTRPWRTVTGSCSPRAMPAPPCMRFSRTRGISTRNGFGP